MLANITQDRFLSRRRFENHLLVREVLTVNGIQTPQIEFLSYRRQGLFYRGEIGVQFVEAGMDVSDYFFNNPSGIPEDWERCISKIAEATARLHAAQVHHPDLNLMNFLYTKDKQIWLLDLDKAMVYQMLPPIKRHQGRQRLERSIRKQGRQACEKILTLMVTAFTENYDKYYDLVTRQ